MKRSSLLVLTLLALLAAAALLPRKGRSVFHQCRRNAVNARDPYLSAAALRWRQCQHAHWRACMLQH